MLTVAVPFVSVAVAVAAWAPEVLMDTVTVVPSGMYAAFITIAIGFVGITSLPAAGI